MGMERKVEQEVYEEIKIEPNMVTPLGDQDVEVAGRAVPRRASRSSRCSSQTCGPIAVRGRAASSPCDSHAVPILV